MADLQGVPNLSMKHLRAVVTLARFGSFIAAASSSSKLRHGWALGFSRAAREACRRPKPDVNLFPLLNGFSANYYNNRKKSVSSMARCEVNLLFLA